VTNAIQPCPICRKAVAPSARYPAYVCTDCSARAVDTQGRSVRYSNKELHGTGIVEETQQPSGEWISTRETIDYRPFDCWIAGVHCNVAEAYFGGIVITAQP